MKEIILWRVAKILFKTANFLASVGLFETIQAPIIMRAVCAILYFAIMECCAYYLQHIDSKLDNLEQ